MQVREFYQVIDCRDGSDIRRRCMVVQFTDENVRLDIVNFINKVQDDGFFMNMTVRAYTDNVGTGGRTLHIHIICPKRNTTYDVPLNAYIAIDEQGVVIYKQEIISPAFNSPKQDPDA